MPTVTFSAASAAARRNAAQRARTKSAIFRRMALSPGAALLWARWRGCIPTLRPSTTLRSAQDEEAFVYGIYQQKMPEKVYLVLSGAKRSRRTHDSIATCL